jgi:hypothetical protein
VNPETVLFECLRFFVHRDEMNAALHFSPVKYSPITFRIAETLRDFMTDQLHLDRDPDVIRVLEHVGRYEEDTGR